MLKGLPGSGKSTWAKEYIKDAKVKTKRVNKDDLRAMLDDGKWSKANESFVLKVRDQIISEALNAKCDVIVDDTNFAAIHEITLGNLAKSYSADLEIKEFKASVRECILRDAARGDRAVGEKVIWDMYYKYVAKPYLPAIYEIDRKDAIIVDLDGTLAHNYRLRSFYDWDKVYLDSVDHEIANILRRFAGDTKILVVSGRDGCCKAITEDWLRSHEIPYDEIFMRSPGSYEKDDKVKKEIYQNEIESKYNVLFVLDDRNSVVDMWRDLGLKCLQVNYGNF